MNRLWNGLRHVFEVLIIFSLLVGGISLFFADPINTGGPVARVLGAQAALVIYGSLFTFEAILLIVSKFLRRKVMHKWVLFAIYLTMIFVILLEWLLTGWSVALIDNVVITFFAGYAWLRWKFTTEYISLVQFQADIDGLREDGLPSKKFDFE